jgi:hypothetical protein
MPRPNKLFRYHRRYENTIIQRIWESGGPGIGVAGQFCELQSINISSNVSELPSTAATTNSAKYQTPTRYYLYLYSATHKTAQQHQSQDPQTLRFSGLSYSHSVCDSERVC